MSGHEPETAHDLVCLCAVEIPVTVLKPFTPADVEAAIRTANRDEWTLLQVVDVTPDTSRQAGEIRTVQLRDVPPAHEAYPS